MKSQKAKKLGILTTIFLGIMLCSTVLTKVVYKVETKGEEKFTIVTSLYPIYIATLNITKDVENVEVINLVDTTAGCAHDYQLTTADMKTLERADVFVMNGAGLEGYLEDVLNAYPELEVIDSSKGVELLAANGESHSHEDEEDHDHSHDHSQEEDHDHSHDHSHEDNEHIWLNPENYKKQIQTIANGLMNVDETHANEYVQNAETYIEKVNAVWKQYKELPAFEYQEVVLFHDSLEYLTNQLGIEVVHSVAMSEDSGLSSGEIAAVIDEVKEHQIQVLFSEKQFEDTIANRIAEETGAKVYVLDSLVTGEPDLDSYLNGMKENLAVIKDALFK